jgi:hypothetical protein
MKYPGYYGHHLRAGPVMTYRFIFNGINVNRGQNTVGEVIQGPVAVDMRLAEASLPMSNFAAPQTQIAACGAVFQPFLQAGLYQLILAGDFSIHSHRADYATRAGSSAIS